MKYKILRRNWNASKRKWEQIIKKLENKEPFDDQHGWFSRNALGCCGYCEEYAYCESCPLFSRRICNDKKDSKAVFWQFANIMRDKKYNRPILDPDFANALQLADKIYNSILQDEKYIYD